MNTFLADIIPQIQRYSKKLDDLTLLTNKHWVLIDNASNARTVFIFRTNDELIISNNGQVEKAKWEYLGNDSLLIDKADGSFLFKHGFFDESILALKVDGKNEYAFFINENKLNGINSIENLLRFLQTNYLGKKTPANNITYARQVKKYNSDKGELEIEQIGVNMFPGPGDKVFMNNEPAVDGKYKLGFMWHIKVVNGEIENVTLI